MQGTEKEGKMKRIGKAKVVNGILFFKFEREEEKPKIKIPKSVKEAAEGVVFGILLLFMLLIAVEANACGADTGISKEYISYCEEIGRAYHICPELLEAVIETESGGNPDAVGDLGEIGLMQVYPKYHMNRAEHLKVYNLFDPKGNILVGADYLAELFQEHEDIGTALMIYNGTKDAVDRGMRGDYTDYAKKIMKRCEQLERLHEK